MSPSDSELMQKHATEAAALLKALSHPSRLMILCLLAQGESCVGDLQSCSDLSQSAFSQHLAVLRGQSLVTTRKEAQTVYYRIADANVLSIIQLLKNLYCP